MLYCLKYHLIEITKFIKIYNFFVEEAQIFLINEIVRISAVCIATKHLLFQTCSYLDITKTFNLGSWIRKWQK